MFFLDGVMSSLPWYLRTFWPRKSKPSLMCVFSVDNSSPHSLLVTTPVTLSPRKAGYGGARKIATRWSHVMKTLFLNSPLQSWAQRYLLAEILSTVCALLAAAGVYALAGHALAAALANTVAGSLSFYAVMLAREQRGGLRDVPRAVGALVLEFGPAEALDTLLVRPSLLYAGMTFGPNPQLGVLLGKLAADVCFYAPAIVSHELLRRRHKRSTLPCRPNSTAVR